MWQYTTETIINSNKGNLVGVDGAKVRVCAYDVKGAAKAAISEASDVLIIDGVNSFIKKYVTRLTKYGPRDPKNAVATITLPAGTGKEGSWRLTVALREEGQTTSIMQDAYLYHSKPFHFEVAVAAADTAAVIAAKFAKVIKKTMALSDFKFFTAAVSGNDLVLTGADCHIRFVEDAIRVDLVGAPDGDIAARVTGYDAYTPVGATVVIDPKGDCGAGTVEHLIKDLRIPTNASINPFAADQGGKPIPGGKYTQYLIEYETPRNHVAHGVMGSVADKSRTSHIIFVESAALSTVGTLIEGLASAESVTIPASGIETPKQEAGSVQ